jgi:hypothetical protein
MYIYTYIHINTGGSEALPMAATLNWVVKDGLGQLGGVVFASVVSQGYSNLYIHICVTCLSVGRHICSKYLNICVKEE